MILLLDNFLKTRYAEYYSVYYNDDLKVLRPPDGVFPTDLDGVEKVILSGSEETILAEDDWIHKEMELVRELRDKNIPTIGLCFGHQLIARALWGRDAVRRRAVPEFGWLNLKIANADPLFAGVRNEFHIFLSHFDEVVKASEELVLLASSEFCNIQAFRVKDTPMWGLQFHPEINVENSTRYLSDLKPLFPDLADHFQSIISSPNDDGMSETILNNFYNFK